MGEDATFRLERATADDLNLIRSQWMADVFLWPDASARGRAYWLETEPDARDDLLAHLGAYVARDAIGVPDNVAAWMVADLSAKPLVHWIQVKRRWRGQGAGRLLFELADHGRGTTMFTRYASANQRPRLEGRGWLYRPHLAYSTFRRAA